MRRNPDFILREINHKPYLLPVNQAMTDFKYGLQLNSIGVFIWKQLEQDKSEEELLMTLLDEYGSDPSEEKCIRNDLNTYLSILRKNDMLLPHLKYLNTFPLVQHLSIAGLKLSMHAPYEALNDNLLSFIDNEATSLMSDLEIFLSFQKPSLHDNGSVLLRNQQMILMENETDDIVIFPMNKKVYEMHMEKSGKKALIFCSNQIDEILKEELFHALRITFLYTATLHGMIMLHSASIFYANKAWLFSAPSGTGKSTHTFLWNREFGTPLINGDLNLIAIESNQPVVYGTPWCGTSGIYDTKTYSLGGIIFLKQNTENCLKSMPEDQKRLSILLRCISPTFREDLLDYHLEVVEKLAGKLLICQLHCTPTKAAVETVKPAIDELLNRYKD